MQMGWATSSYSIRLSPSQQYILIRCPIKINVTEKAKFIRNAFLNREKCKIKTNINKLP
jgi:hypothetical protein